MKMHIPALNALAIACGVAALVASATVHADIAAATRLQQENGVLGDYRRLLPLEGGSNFRDMGGYPAMDGKRVRRGLLFRSGAPSSLSDADHAYLARFGIESVMDLRSSEELDLYPNRWVATADIDYYTIDYSIVDMLAARSPEQLQDLSVVYPDLAYSIKPQMTQYFTLLAEGKAPIVVNCSAGQDRTGITSALLLSVLGVPREIVVEDYLLSSDFRRPAIERGSVDLAAAAETNAFAAMMARYAQGETTHASPLMTAEGRPFLDFALDRIEADYGSIEGFMTEGLGLSAAQLQSIRELYLE